MDDREHKGKLRKRRNAYEQLSTAAKYGLGRVKRAHELGLSQSESQIYAIAFARLRALARKEAQDCTNKLLELSKTPRRERDKAKNDG